MKYLSKKSMALIALVLLMTPSVSHAMHIMEGFLPVSHAIFWGVLAIPFVLFGLKQLSSMTKADQNTKLLLGLVGGFVFVLSALKIPSVNGSCSHPTGIGLGAILFGPGPMFVIGFIVLIFQSVMLAHGGLTTLGANTFSMAIVGALVSYGLYRLLSKDEKHKEIAVFVGATLGNMATYVVTSIQLAAAFPDPVGGIGASMVKFLSVFAVTQVPLAIVEGLLTVVVFNLITEYQEKGVISYEKF